MGNVFKVLEQRGFIQQTTHEKLMETLERPITCYAGFDPTADSIHAGHLLPIMLLAHFQRAGHRPIAVIGGATAMVGDPSGKDKMRSMLSPEDIGKNIGGMKQQIERFIDFKDDKALMLNNATWLKDVNYINFLRDIGVHFSVNRMLTADCFKLRMEKETGLSFLEFNYMLLQAYDFLMLFRQYHCVLQVGGDDQWSNILAGADLVRRVEQQEAFGLTHPLITTSTGAKMGKTEKGAIWLDEHKCPVNDFYQYWRNTDDRDVCRFLKFFTFRELDDIAEMTAASGEGLNRAKRVLAYDITRTIHGPAKARAALLAEKEVFGIPENDWNYIKAKAALDDTMPVSSALPASRIARRELEGGVSLVRLLADVGLAGSLSEARRLIRQGGIYINRQRQDDTERRVTGTDVEEGRIELRSGKKKYHVLQVE